MATPPSSRDRPKAGEAYQDAAEQATDDQPSSEPVMTCLPGGRLSGGNFRKPERHFVAGIHMSRVEHPRVDRQRHLAIVFAKQFVQRSGRRRFQVVVQNQLIRNVLASCPCVVNGFDIGPANGNRSQFAKKCLRKLYFLKIIGLELVADPNVLDDFHKPDAAVTVGLFLDVKPVTDSAGDGQCCRDDDSRNAFHEALSLSCVAAVPTAVSVSISRRLTGDAVE